MVGCSGARTLPRLGGGARLAQNAGKGKECNTAQNGGHVLGKKIDSTVDGESQIQNFGFQILGQITEGGGEGIMKYRFLSE